MSSVAVIGNYNGDAVLEECVASIRTQTLEPTEIVVVDGGSTDGSAALAARLGTRVLAQQNLGLGYLYNRGVEAVEAEYVFLANNDIALEPRCLEHLADALSADAHAFAADARQLDWSGERTIHARTTLRRGRLLREYLPGLHLDPNVPADAIAPTVCANGAAMLVKREPFLDLRGFDETFFMEWEDLDLCWRAWLRGWQTLYVPEAVVRHRVGAVTTSAEQPKRSVSSHHNLLRFALKCLPAPAAARVIAGELLRAARYPAIVPRALAAIALELPQIVRDRRNLASSRETYERLLSLKSRRAVGVRSHAHEEDADPA